MGLLYGQKWTPNETTPGVFTVNVNGTTAPDPRGAACDRDQLHVCSVFDSKQPPTPSSVLRGEGCSLRSLLLLSWLSQGREIKVSEALDNLREKEREKKDKIVETKTVPSSYTSQVDTFKKMAARCDGAVL